MSIIHEALKKVQANLQKQPPAPIEQIAGQPPVEQVTAQPPVEPAASDRPPAEDKTAPTPEKTKPHHHTLPMVLAAAGTVIAALWFLLPLVIRYFPQIKIPFNLPHTMIKVPSMHESNPAVPLAKIIIPPAAAQPQTATPNNPTAPPSKPVVFNIEGVMTKNGSTVALINGKIYERGDEIGGAKITNIGADTITISRDGTEETIPVRH